MLPDFGWSELLVIAIILIVIVGPKDLPKMLRTFGKTTASLRKMAGDFRRQFDEALKEAELDDVRQIANDVRGLDPRNQLKGALNPLGKIGQDLNEDLKKAAKEIDDATKPPSAAESALAASGDKMKAAQAKAEKPKAAAKKPAGSKPASAKRKAPAAKPSAKAAASGSTAPKGAAKTAAAEKPAKPAAARTAAKKTTAGAAKSGAAKSGAAKSGPSGKSSSAAKTAAAKSSKSKSAGDKS
ncbi:MAG: hypothetical protein Kow0026_07960 [Oricola sp.]